METLLQTAPPEEADDRLITPEGYEALRRRLDALVDARRPAAERLRQVRASESDLSESVEYAAALDQAEELEQEIGRLQGRLAELRVRRHRQRGAQAALGSTVLLAFDGERMRVRLVGADEADALEGRVSTRSPLGRALIGRSAGETIRWSAPDGEIAARVLRIA